MLASEIDPHDPMEKAFHRLAGEQLLDTEHLHPQWALAREYELSPELLAMSHLWRSGAVPHDVVAAKGAPEAIANLCHLDDARHGEVTAEAARMADRGLGCWGWRKHDTAAARTGQRPSMTSPSNGSAWSGWPTRCATRSHRRLRVAGRPVSA